MEEIKPKRKGTWVKGQSGNPNGRPLGSKNKSTIEIRKIIQEVISSQMDLLQEDLMNVKTSERLFIMEKLLKYFLPTLTKSEIDQNNTGNIKVQIVYEDKEAGDSQPESNPKE